MNPKSVPVRHNLVFSLLVSLVLISVGVSLLHLPPSLNNLIVLGIAFVMAGLVVAEYMGLKREGPMVGVIIAIPVVLFTLLVVLLLPDISHVPIHFWGKQ